MINLYRSYRNAFDRSDAPYLAAISVICIACTGLLCYLLAAADLTGVPAGLAGVLIGLCVAEIILFATLAVFHVATLAHHLARR